MSRDSNVPLSKFLTISVCSYQ